MTSSGLWILTLFTALSLGAYRDFDFLPTLSSRIHSLLGSGPPTNFINWALVLYGFSGIIMVLTQMTSSKRPRGALSHFGYLSAFYTFYHFSGGLTENFWAVFTVGMTILSLQSYHVWNYYRDKIHEQEEILIELNKLAEDRSAAN
ncbi:hypothetical protein [Geopsychrobacter electrodiphilus]|uniref:hypothetical protein n=1 Tax=Geopsychrobacter electrodiphilus TaxID=225196 RepID=UPI00035E5268|nr:hypothetical protein [Geopsychrobacter electrodiphilus]